MDDIIKKFTEENKQELFSLLKELCAITAPSHMEQRRAAFCENWLKNNGVSGVYTDEALNVIVPMGKMENITVFVAHTDTVFPDTEPMPYSEHDGKIFCPGVGDDTACLAIMMMSIKFFTEKKIPLDGVLFVANSCEEGLGNLKGTRTFMEKYSSNVKQFISLDGKLGFIHTTCVGSHRYEVSVSTKGGHSFQNFGNENAIVELSKIINKIYETKVPNIENSKTTYNVGITSGGTSVNTIAQKATMLCEYRSDNYECLDIMKKKFAEIFSAAEKDNVSIDVKLIGERPCSAGVDAQKEQLLASTCTDILQAATGLSITDIPASTDCNIPLSIGIPAVCVGVYEGGGAHTREEWVVKDSLPVGLNAAILLVDALTKGQK